MTIEGKYKLELNFPGDGRCFLSFWDSIHGNDVVVEVKGGRLYYSPENASTYTIPLSRFISLVEESINKRNI